jgi:hypothetical protein
MMVDWFANSWLITAVISTLFVKPFAVMVIHLIPADVAAVPAAAAATV